MSSPRTKLKTITEKKLKQKTVEQFRICEGSPMGREGSTVGRICEKVAFSTYIAVSVDVLSVGKRKAEPSIVAVELFALHLLHLTTENCPIPLGRNTLRTAHRQLESSTLNGNGGCGR